MGAKAKFNLYLRHQETGQRYLVGDEVVIGRRSGDLLFTSDRKMSNSHCRIFKTDQGLMIEDLGSSNGTEVDGEALTGKTPRAFKAGSKLTVGEQVFTVIEMSLERKKRAKKNNKKVKHSSSSFDFTSILFVIVALSAVGSLGYLYFNPLREKRAPQQVIESPVAMIEKEMQQAFDDYGAIGRAHSSGQISDQELVGVIREKLLPAMKAVLFKMEVLRPHGEWERHKVDLNKKLLHALVGQLNALALYTETKSPRFQADLQKFSEEAETHKKALQKVRRSF